MKNNKIEVLGFYSKNDGFNGIFKCYEIIKDDKKGVVIEPIKENKNKNSFSKLREQLRSTLSRLDTANRTNNILELEVERLRSVLDIQQKQVAVLNDQLKTEANRTSNLTNSLLESKENKDWWYEQWIKDHIKIGKYKQIATYSIVINIIGLAIIIFRSL